MYLQVLEHPVGVHRREEDTKVGVKGQQRTPVNNIFKGWTKSGETGKDRKDLFSSREVSVIGPEKPGNHL